MIKSVEWGEYGLRDSFLIGIFIALTFSYIAQLIQTIVFYKAPEPEKDAAKDVEEAVKTGFNIMISNI